MGGGRGGDAPELGSLSAFSQPQCQARTSLLHPEGVMRRMELETAAARLPWENQKEALHYAEGEDGEG